MPSSSYRDRGKNLRTERVGYAEQFKLRLKRLLASSVSIPNEEI